MVAKKNIVILITTLIITQSDFFILVLLYKKILCLKMLNYRQEKQHNRVGTTKVETSLTKANLPS